MNWRDFFVTEKRQLLPSAHDVLSAPLVQAARVAAYFWVLRKRVP